MGKSADRVAQILEAIGPAKKGGLMAKMHSAPIPRKAVSYYQRCYLTLSIAL
jgi:hypothetical protein